MQEFFQMLQYLLATNWRDVIVGDFNSDLLMILTGKTVFYSIQYKNGWLAASDLFDMFTRSIEFYDTFHYQVLRVQMLEECDSSSRR